MQTSDPIREVWEKHKSLWEYILPHRDGTDQCIASLPQSPVGAALCDAARAIKAHVEAKQQVCMWTYTERQEGGFYQGTCSEHATSDYDVDAEGWDCEGWAGCPYCLNPIKLVRSEEVRDV